MTVLILRPCSIHDRSTQKGDMKLTARAAVEQGCRPSRRAIRDCSLIGFVLAHLPSSDA